MNEITTKIEVPAPRAARIMVPLRLRLANCRMPPVPAAMMAMMGTKVNRPR